MKNTYVSKLDKPVLPHEKPCTEVIVLLMLINVLIVYSDENKPSVFLIFAFTVNLFYCPLCGNEEEGRD